MPAPAAFVVPSLAAALVDARFCWRQDAGGAPTEPVDGWWRSTAATRSTQMVGRSCYWPRHASGVFRVRQPASVNGSAVLNAARAFFSQPDGVKRPRGGASGASGGFERGYIPLAGESGLRQFVELKEGFCYGREAV